MSSAAPLGYRSPAVRALTRLHAVDLAGRRGSGANGRVTLADVLSFLAPSSSAQPQHAEVDPGRPNGPAGGEILEVQVDVTGDERPGTDIAAAVSRALRDVNNGNQLDVNVVVRDEGATRVIPPMRGQAAVGVGAPYWAPAAVLTADGQRVVTSRILRTVAVRALADANSAVLLSAAAAAVADYPRSAQSPV